MDDLLNGILTFDLAQLKTHIQFALDRYMTFFVRAVWESILPRLDKALILNWLIRIFKYRMETDQMMDVTIKCVVEVQCNGDLERAALKFSTIGSLTSKRFVEALYKYIATKVQPGRVWETIRYLAMLLIPPIELIKLALADFQTNTKSLKFTRELVNVVTLMPDKSKLKMRHYNILLENWRKMEEIVVERNEQPELEK